jgi:hypothetical protein
MTMNNIPIIDQKFEKIAIRRLVRKLDRRIIPFMCLLEAASYINRVSIGRYLSLESSISDNTLLGYAELMDIKGDQNSSKCLSQPLSYPFSQPLSQSEINWSVSLFFLAYVRKLLY